MKKKNITWFYLLFSGLLLSLLFCCSKNKKGIVDDNLTPTIIAQAVANITATSATAGGVVTSDGGSDITARGVCWCISQNPTTTNDKTSDGTGSGSFTSFISGLTANTTYTLRAYATNSAGTAYSEVSTFSTIGVAPVLTTGGVSVLSATSVICGGNVTQDGGAAIIARGVCWGTHQNPTTSDNKTSNGLGLGSFSSSITGLLPATTYYFRAYATNTIGTSYGNQQTAATPAVVPVITTSKPSSITAITAASGGNISNDGGATVTGRGVCWDLTQNPTINSNKTTDGTGSGIFTSNITGLTANTTYYVRAYASNSAGTAYGNEFTFTTAPLTLNDAEGNVYHTVSIGTQVWLVENLKSTTYNDGTLIPYVEDNKAWANNISPGYCWYNNDVTTKTSYGALYNWYTVNTGKLCPSGWHVPNDAEWTILTTFLGGINTAGGKLKEAGTTLWISPNTGATNETGFTAIPGGARDATGPFFSMGYSCFLWSATELNVSDVLYRSLRNSSSEITRDSNYRIFGYSVRCLRD
jgi:uncharacterized protein (TIGR02145 family)